MTKTAAALAALALAAPALARQVAGVQFADTLTVGGRELKLNGAGIRTKLFVKVYAGALYLAEPSQDAAAILAADGPRRVRMVFLRDVDKKKIMETYREGFQKNSAGPELQALLAKLDRIAPAIVDMRRGAEMFVTYVPGEGTTVASAGATPVTIEGKDFADAMFRNWLGSQPADADLKKAMLGR
ncbi:MAG TPA: chalcone isomerase family protein [Anaeromyxobacter sp.]|nr:chalcone isomerase family protein [Anaeromyxobacter sp.]